MRRLGVNHKKTQRFVFANRIITVTQDEIIQKKTFCIKENSQKNRKKKKIDDEKKIIKKKNQEICKQDGLSNIRQDDWNDRIKKIIA